MNGRGTPYAIEGREDGQYSMTDKKDPNRLIPMAPRFLTGEAVSAEAPGGLESAQLGLFPSAPDPVLKELLALELSTLTPLQALNLLHEWQQRLRSQP